MLRNNQRNSLRVKQREENDFKKKMIAVEGRDMIRFIQIIRILRRKQNMTAREITNMQDKLSNT